MTDNIPTVRISGLNSLISGIPSMIGFEPAESIVIVGLDSNGRLQVTARFDLDDVFDMIDDTLESLVRGGVVNAVVIDYTADAGRSTLNLCVAAFDLNPDITMIDHLRVTDGRYFGNLCDNEECCPSDGKPISQDNLVAAVAAVGGINVAKSREALYAELTPTDLQWQGARPDWANLDLDDLDDRDTLWHMIENGDVDHDGIEYLRHQARIADEGHRAPALFLWAWNQWRDGDGARARIGLEACVNDDPHYTASQILGSVLRSGVDPRALPRLGS